MPLTPEQVKQLKEQLKSQIAAQKLPKEKEKAALKQVDNLSAGAVELMLQQSPSSATKKQDSNQGSPPGKSIFRMIVSGEINSIKIAENETALAVLDINPISRGHTLIIPKKPIKQENKILKSTLELAESIEKKFKENLKAKSVKSEKVQQFGEYIIHLIPVYDKPLDINSERTQATPKELQEVKSELDKEIIKVKKTKPRVIKIKKKETPKESEVVKLHRRIP